MRTVTEYQRNESTLNLPHEETGREMLPNKFWDEKQRSDAEPKKTPKQKNPKNPAMKRNPKALNFCCAHCLD